MQMREASVVAGDLAAAGPDGTLAAALVETAADIVVVTDEFGILRYANPAAVSLLGDDPAAVPGTSLFDLIHPEGIEEAAGALASTVASSALHAVPLELRLHAGDGSWRRLEAIATNLIAHPQVRGIVFRCPRPVIPGHRPAPVPLDVRAVTDCTSARCAGYAGGDRERRVSRGCSRSRATRC